MHSELPRPELADTPELFDRIDNNLRLEATRIRERHLARVRRHGWMDHVRPVMTAGAAMAATLILIPLTQQPATMGAAEAPPPTPGVVQQVVAEPTSQFTLDRHLPAADVDVDLLGGDTSSRSDPIDYRAMIPEEDLRDMGDAGSA